MAFPPVDSVTPSVFSIAATAHLVAMPATVNAGDLLVVKFVVTTSTAITTPTNWNLLHSTANGGAVRLGSYYKIAVGNEDGTTVDFVTANSRRAVAHTYRISAWHGTTPPEIGTPATGSDTAPNPPTLTPSWGAEDTLWLVAFASDTLSTVSSYPTSYTDGFDDQSTTISPSMGSARRELNATSDDPGTFTISLTSSWVAQTIAIRPGAGGATGTVAVTQADQTSTASGVVLNPITGTVAVTQAAQTSTASGLETISGTVAVTQAAQTSTASGVVANPVTGTVAVTQAGQTSTASGTETITGTVAVTQANQTSTASGLETITGTSATTQANQTSTASGTVTSNDVAGSAAVTQADQTSIATGTVLNPVTGTVAVTQANQTSTASGTVVSNDVTGTASVTQANQTSSAAGIVLIVGTAGITQADQTSTASGTSSSAIIGTAAVTQEDQFATAEGTHIRNFPFWPVTPETGWPSSSELEWQGV